MRLVYKIVFLYSCASGRLLGQWGPISTLMWCFIHLNSNNSVYISALFCHRTNLHFSLSSNCKFWWRKLIPLMQPTTIMLVIFIWLRIHIPFGAIKEASAQIILIIIYTLR
jgi:hypothetical protein